VSAKDFRTWNATVLAAVALSVSGLRQDTKTGRKRVIVRAIKEVAGYLGNTPAVARASYIDPRVFDRFNDGLTIDPLSEPGEVEAAVLDLIADDEGSDRLTEAEELDELVPAA
jgi:DNA topoisomerase IB